MSERAEMDIIVTDISTHDRECYLAQSMWREGTRRVYGPQREGPTPEEAEDAVRRALDADDLTAP